MKLKKHFSLIFILALFLFNNSITLVSSEDEAENEVEFNYKEGGDIGPEKWGAIKEEWALCGKGKMQSPINIVHDHVTVLPDLGALNRSYHPAPALLKNRGHDIMLKWEDEAGSIWINETQYILKQLHWHSPSEHEINGRRYSLEMHMVHESDDKKTAVVSFLYTIGKRDPFLARVEDYIAKIGKVTGKEEKVGIVDPREIKRGSRKYYRYVGSLTVPPCTEGVVWTIEKKVRTVTRKQVELLREAVHDDFNMNARPVQMLNDRIVSMFRPIYIQN